MTDDFDFINTPLQPGLSVIEASAGTGKTFAISHLVPRLLLDGTAQRLANILLVTFTNDAAAELAGRVRDVLEQLAALPDIEPRNRNPALGLLLDKFGPERIRTVIGRALLDLDRLSVSTIHSFCLQTLQTEGTSCGLPVIPELVPDADKLGSELLRDLWETTVAGDPLLAAIAVEAGWKLSDDLAFLRSAGRLEDVEFLPVPRALDEVLDWLRAAPALFTASACDELRDIFARVGDKGWLKADIGADRRAELLDRLAAAKAPDDPGFFQAVKTMAQAPAWIGIRSKAGKALRAEAEAAAAVCAAAATAGLLDESGWHFRIDGLQRVHASVEQALCANRQITYDGLIGTLHRALLAGGTGATLAASLRARYEVALIDESQDTDLRQFEIFQSIFLDAEEPRRLVMIGDPKQAIYAFRGADVNTYLRARDLAGDRVYSLTKTFRAPQQLVRATNAIFSRPGALLKDGLGFRPAVSGIEGDIGLWLGGEPAGARIDVWVTPDDDDDFSTTAGRRERISAAVAAEIARLLGAGAVLVDPKSGSGGTAVVPRDFAVLVSDRSQARAAAEALRKAGVPAVRAGGDDVLATDEAADMLAVLRAVEDPRRTGLVLAALATRLVGRSASALRGMREGNGEEPAARFLHWQEIWWRDGIAALLGRIELDENLLPRLAAAAEGERRITNYRQLAGLLQQQERQAGGRPADLIRWLAAECGGAGGEVAAEERQLQLESDADAVRVVTMHAAKGLQYPLVFCPFLWSARAPAGIQYLPRAGQPGLLANLGAVGDPALRLQFARAAIEDRLRLAYVAITRARVKIWLVAGENSGSRKPVPPSALDWLLREDPDMDFATWLETAHVPGRAQRHQAGLAALATAGDAKDLIRWQPIPPATACHWQAPPDAAGRELANLPAPTVPSGWGMTSFSALTREKHPHGSGDRIPLPSADAVPLANPFVAAPGGTIVGTAVHDWIEQWDCGPVDANALAMHLGKYQVPASNPPFPSAVGGMLQELRGSILPGLDATVAQACPSSAASEWHFQLPIHASLGPADLAQVFAAHGNATYAGLLEALPADELQGYLHGFLDRIAVHAGKWGVVDWKTNRLGEVAAAYAPQALLECAMRSHYFLQTHLYLVALRRFLRGSAPLAGAWLVFLRAVRAGSSDGVLHIAPSMDLLDELDALFARPAL